MADDDSITRWIQPARDGSQEAAEHLWQRFYGPLVERIRHRLGNRRRVSDEEDVAQSTFQSFFRRLQEGQFPALGDRDEIWRLLVEVAVCKSTNQLRDQNRLKRGGGNVSGESIFLRADSQDTGGLDGFVADQASPEVALQVVEEIERLFSLLDEQAQQIVACRVEGYTDAQTAEVLGCSKATVERRLKVIRAKWRAEVP